VKQFEGKAIMRVDDSQRPKYPAPEAAALDAEVYLNGEVANEVYHRFGVALRVHVQGEATEQVG